ncbi:MAG: enoyl-CoA hydratase-related protein [bacterium]
MTDILITEQKGSLLILQMNRPDSLNSFNRALLCALRDAFGQAHHDDTIRAVLLTGTGRGFCAGADLAEMPLRDNDTPPDLETFLKTYYQPLVEAITQLPKPVIAAVNGIAAGAGCSMALNCDIVIAARKAQFLLAFSRIGLIPDAGVTWQLPRLIGQAKAMGLAMLADTISAEDAERLGMIWQVVDDEEFENTAQALAMRLANGPTQALAHIKALMRHSSQQTLTEQMQMEARGQGQAAATADFMEGVSAFLQKRKAEFTGK